MYHRHPLNFLKVIRDETSGDYGKMMSYAISSRSDYIGEMIDAACDGWGCDEAKLVDLFVMFGQEALYEGKEAWEEAWKKSAGARRSEVCARTAERKGKGNESRVTVQAGSNIIYTTHLHDAFDAAVQSASTPDMSLLRCTGP